MRNRGTHLFYAVCCRIFMVVVLLSFPLVSSASEKREMRGVWIATVANIDWPSAEAVGNTDLQQKEMLRMLDRLQDLKFNTIIFQVRPTADALYLSDKEPISHWLSGKQSSWQKYDALQFVLDEAHKRCMDVHVWVNPYRVTLGYDISELDSTHIYWQHKNWFLKYGDRWYFDPGLNETREWLNSVVADIVERYDVDAIHMDDYFYPYKVYEQQKGVGRVAVDFPDTASFRTNSRGFTDKEAWRRDNVDLVIQELQQTIKERKPWVEFGISPFGVWRNSSTDPKRGSKTQAGVQNYDDLYADILLWLEKGWIDYVVPQLYWEIGKKVADYEVLAHWWAENSYGKNLYVGHYASGLGAKKAAAAWREPNELCRQFRLNEKIAEIDGSILYSAAPLLKNPVGIVDSLQTYYKNYALPPISRNLSGYMPLAPVNARLDGHKLEWDTPFVIDQSMRYVVYGFPLGKEIDFDKSEYILTVTSDLQYELDEPDRYEVICITSLNRFKQESLPCILPNLVY